MAESPYKLSLDLNVLNHLGIHLYSNVPAVLSEAVANAWDADAKQVIIEVDDKQGSITITDDGIGMDVDDINDKYLKVGYRRRDDGGGTTDGGRKVMGRKGIGKLSLFSIADTVEVHSVKGEVRHGLVMHLPDIKKKIESKTESSTEYRPRSVAVESVNIGRGTRIRLTDLKKRRISRGAELRKRIARRFSIFDAGFKVVIDGREVTLADRDDLSKAQFLWEIGEENVYGKDECPLLEKRGHFDGVLPANEDWRLHGWIGAATVPKNLVSQDGGNLNSIVVLARGRLIQENILDRINDGRIFTKYLTGQIEANFLDVDNEEDIATSDRQRVVEDDPRYLALEAHIKTTLNKIADDWDRWRVEVGEKKVRETHPDIGRWIDGLPSKDEQRRAKKLMATITSLPMDDETKRRELYRNGILAFERMRLRADTEEFLSALDAGADELLRLFGDADQYEASLYLDIVRQRLGTIRAFTGLVDANEKEKVLQKYLFGHLWLIDASWERAAGSERIETRLKRDFKEFSPNLSDEESKGRVDIKYTTTARKHVVVELKRAQRELSVFELSEQGFKYRSALERCLEAADQAGEPIEIVFVLGKPVKERDPEVVKKQMDSIGARIVYYDQLITSAESAYREFIDKHAEVDRIESILKNV